MKETSIFLIQNVIKSIETQSRLKNLSAVREPCHALLWKCSMFNCQPVFYGRFLRFPIITDLWQSIEKIHKEISTKIRIGIISKICLQKHQKTLSGDPVFLENIINMEIYWKFSINM